MRNKGYLRPLKCLHPTYKSCAPNLQKLCIPPTQVVHPTYKSCASHLHKLCIPPTQVVHPTYKSCASDLLMLCIRGLYDKTHVLFYNTFLWWITRQLSVFLETWAYLAMASFAWSIMFYQISLNMFILDWEELFRHNIMFSLYMYSFLQSIFGLQ